MSAVCCVECVKNNEKDKDEEERATANKGK